VNSRAKQIRNNKQPLTPINSLLFVEGSVVTTLTPSEINHSKVGLKAFGLASIPIEWTKPYFVVSGTTPSNQDAIDKAFALAGLTPNRSVLVRSSGVDESIDRRGSLVSAPCFPNEISSKISQLINSHEGCAGSEIHWLIQEQIITLAKGHLSNERRLSRDLRDWTAEAELSSTNKAESTRIAIRPWREGQSSSVKKLRCKYRPNYVDRLKDVARWTYDRKIRVHFEWVWDGNFVYIVQADPADHISAGVDPEQLVKIPSGNIDESKLKIFRTATESEFKKYRKLANANIYQGLGYGMPNFYVLDDQNEIQSIIKQGICSKELLQDLEQLTLRPLVIRTDGLDIPNGKRHMLPRSDELRSVQAAAQWFIEKFRTAITKGDLHNCKLCLLAHHFIPAVASAWCQAYPAERRVRIESLWGIPEGLYWYAHDVFDVDTLVINLSAKTERPKGLKIRERTRFKSRFIAPDENGTWVVHQAFEEADWRRSIQRDEWIEEIAWTSRQIAQKAGHPVVVMWFIDIPSVISTHRVLPWFHECWEQKGHALRAAPREKLPSTGEFLLRTKVDWEKLKNKLTVGESFSRVVVDPSEPEMVRDQDFANKLSELAKEKQFIVELSGGILSHAYYMLSSSGCTVECVDLDDFALEDSEVAFNKLVRDLIPESISARGEDVALFILEGEALIAALRQKLVEEAFEVMDAPTTIQIVEELADVREVMLALMARLDISESDVEDVRLQKVTSRGRFDAGLLLSKTKLVSTFNSPEKDMIGDKNIPSPRTLYLQSEMPTSLIDIHVDKRFDEQGAMERQFSVVLPAHAENIGELKTIVSLNTRDGTVHKMILNVNLERKNAELRFKLRLINTAKQLELPFDS